MISLIWVCFFKNSFLQGARTLLRVLVSRGRQRICCLLFHIWCHFCVSSALANRWGLEQQGHGRVTALPPQVQSTTEPDGTHSPNPSAFWGLEGVTHRCFQRSFPAYHLGFLSPDPRTPRVMMGEGTGPRAAFMSHVPL